jgi:sortase A
MTRTDQRISPRQRVRSVVAVLESLLFMSGVVCLAVYVSACAQRSSYQSHVEEVFDQALAEQLAQLQVENHDQSDWSAERKARFEASRNDVVSALGRLEIPVAGISVMLLEGTDDRTLDRGVGRIEGTARPGQPGNLGIAGHRDGFFRGLRHLTRGDEIQLSTLQGRARYQVVDLRIVSPRDVTVLENTPEPSLTLVTCYPFYFVGDAPKRFIVVARQQSFEAWTPTRGSQHATR